MKAIFYILWANVDNIILLAILFLVYILLRTQIKRFIKVRNGEIHKRIDGVELKIQELFKSSSELKDKINPELKTENNQSDYVSRVNLNTDENYQEPIEVQNLAEPNEICIYSDPPNSDGLFLFDFMSSVKNPNSHLYKIILENEKADKGSLFLLLDHLSVVDQALEYPDSFLHTAANVIETKSGEGKLELDEPGFVRKTADGWMIEKKIRALIV
jgi:hypothetical protein